MVTWLKQMVDALERIEQILLDIRYEIEQQGLGDERVWELDEVADRLGISERTVRRRIHDGRVPLESRHEGGKQVIPHRILLNYLRNLPERPLRTRGGRPRKNRGTES